MKSTKYITSMGDLKRKDDSLCFRKSGKNIYLPVENIKEIYCLNEISLNTKLLDFISSKNIIIHFLTIIRVIVVPFIQRINILVVNC